jgi:hypothetical protein
MRSALIGTRLGAPVISRRAATGILTLAALFAVGLMLTALRDAGPTGPLDWSGRAEVFVHPTLPGDRVLTGMLRNDGLHPLRVDIGAVRVLEADGTVVPSAPVFLGTFGRSLWAAGRGPQEVPDSELQRTGRIAFLAPGEQVPLTIAWHAADGDPVLVDYGRGSLKLPG